MSDGRAKNGGKRPGAGRKSKAAEMGLAALLDDCWTPAARRRCIRALSKKADEGDIEAIKLLMAYTFGKPREKVELSGTDSGAIRILVEYDDPAALAAPAPGTSAGDSGSAAV